MDSHLEMLGRCSLISQIQNAKMLLMTILGLVTLPGDRIHG